MRTLLLSTALCTTLVASAQDHTHAERDCAAHTFTKRHLEQQGLSTDLLNALPRFEGAPRGGTYTIPVVVHVVWNTAAENVPTATIQALIDEMNEDYSASNSDISGVRSSFISAIGDVGFQFCLAQVDPNGAATTGITRTQTTDTWFDPDTQTNDMKSAPLGKAPWDTERYLNIWICDITSGATGGTITVGYAYLPTGGIVGSNIDGLVIDYDYGTELGGRTATHEVGHYFGLLHTFDDDGACVNADGFTDTPTSNSPTFSCTNTSLMKCGVLTQYENFMDYSNCTAMFTDQQAAYMANILTGVREGLLTNNACSGPVTGICIPTSANGPADGDFINRVSVGSINNVNSGGVDEPAYTDFSSTFSTNLQRTTQYTLTVQGGDYAPDHYAAWIDYDQDEVFEANEKLGEFVTAAADETQTITFTVPVSAALGNTVLRVRGVFHNQGEPTPDTDPCFNYAFGETEDYGINITSGGGGTGVCIPTSTNGTADGDFINAVLLEGIAHENSGGTTAPTYTDFSSTYSTTLFRNGVYSVLVQGGAYAPDNYAVWIDYDQNDTFDADEKLGEFATEEAEQAFLINFQVPTDAVTGATTMRVRGVYFNTGEPEPVDPCFSYAYGETEDYAISIIAPATDHCTPGSLNGTGDGDFIDGVVLADIDNTNSGSVDGPAYTDYSATDLTTLPRGTSQTLTITGGDYTSDNYAAWIDFDQNDNFELDEKLGEFVTAAAGESQTITFNVPSDAVLGPTRLRIRGVFHAQNEPVPTDPCYPYVYGETEDYGIVITTTTGVAEGSELVFGLFPNPAAHTVTIALPSDEPAMVQLRDLQGRLVLETVTRAQQPVLDIASLASGTYLVHVQQADRIRTERLEVLNGGR